MSAVTKLYTRTHQFLTKPVNGVAHLGLSLYAKTQLVWFLNLQTNYNLKLLNGLQNRARLQDLAARNPESLSFEEQLLKNNCTIRKEECVTLIETKQFDVQLMAPVDLSVIDLNVECLMDWRTIADQSWLFKVRIWNEEQLETLLSEEQYDKIWKFVEFV